jgi:hypothetical protein
MTMNVAAFGIGVLGLLIGAGPVPCRPVQGPWLEKVEDIADLRRNGASP